MDLNRLKRNIRERRRALNISQEELAKKMGVSYQTINTWENNPPASFSGANIDKLSNILECNKAWLMGDDSQEPVEVVRDGEEKYSNPGIAEGTQNKVVLLQSDIKTLEAKLDDKQKIIELLEEKVRDLKHENAELKGRLKDGTTSK